MCLSTASYSRPRPLASSAAQEDRPWKRTPGRERPPFPTAGMVSAAWPSAVAAPAEGEVLQPRRAKVEARCRRRRRRPHAPAALRKTRNLLQPFRQRRGEMQTAQDVTYGAERLVMADGTDERRQPRRCVEAECTSPCSRQAV